MLTNAQTLAKTKIHYRGRFCQFAQVGDLLLSLAQGLLTRLFRLALDWLNVPPAPTGAHDQLDDLDSVFYEIVAELVHGEN